MPFCVRASWRSPASRLCLVGLAAALFLTGLASCGGGASPTAPSASTFTTSLASLTLDMAIVTGGESLSGTATVSTAAPAGGTSVTLRSSESAARVPATVTVAEGTTSATFRITTTAVEADEVITVTGAAGGVTKSAAFAIAAAAGGGGGPIAAFTSAADDLTGGKSTTGTITLRDPAPAGGTTIALASTQRAVILPDSVTVPAGARTTTFDIGTRAVTVETTAVVTAALAAIRATSGDVAGGAPAVNGGATLTIVVRPASPSTSSTAPTLTSIAPTRGRPGQTVSATLIGTHFTGHGTVTLAVSGGDVGVADLVVVSDTQITATLVIADPAVFSARSVTVRTSAGTSGAQVFSVSTAPVVDADAYAAAEDTTLTVAAPGVLDGDTDADGGALTAALVTGTANGTLTLNGNGSFTYVPGPNFNGTDSFTYRASDGTETSDTATVTLTVAAVTDEMQFAYTGSNQTFVVPAGVSAITLVASGAQGGDPTASDSGGLGGTVTATVGVAANETLCVVVGGSGDAGGFNGGASAGAGVGGGASDVRRAACGLGNRIVAGGGGGGVSAGHPGGPGGGLTGGAGGAVLANAGGGGGTQSAGGAGGLGGFGGGSAGSPGALGTGGSGAANAGGGGGGYFGGGGGAGGANAGGGGGGSSFTIPGATDLVHQQGNHAGNGLVIIRW